MYFTVPRRPKQVIPLEFALLYNYAQNHWGRFNWSLFVWLCLHKRQLDYSLFFWSKMHLPFILMVVRTLFLTLWGCFVSLCGPPSYRHTQYPRMKNKSRKKGKITTAQWALFPITSYYLGNFTICIKVNYIWFIFWFFPQSVLGQNPEPQNCSQSLLVVSMIIPQSRMVILPSVWKRVWMDE